MATQIVVADQSSMPPTNSKTQSLPDLVSRLSRLDETLTPADCDLIIAALDADQAPAGLDYATIKAKSIMRVHPRHDVDDPQAYLLAIAAIMSEYPKGVLDFVSDPRTGIVRKIKFLPRPAEIAEACDDEMKKRSKLRENTKLVAFLRNRKAAA